ncbi:sulfoxide reductase heme-binding subunit YedZ [Methylobacterium organophilum]|uniref:sulfite oxidase heme-binding subunit YedZ n=1 Tax=Methylobacterium organophilum TaxID=410 RepID=UPI001F130994|nr:protein-methionine-sulfoxide reductase heme-binding subunit MsrQ [Methylobacterium organophilum]UMY16961.1 sulfoxide reductase heme-binding subunit YedZ [Methylobacterium organophilum]
MPAQHVLALPWLDRAGRLSPLKLVTFLLLLAPGLYLAGAFYADALGAKPLTALIHETGKWAVRLLLITLAVSPLRRIGDWPRLILVRRMLGLSVLAYALIHLTLYAADQNFALGTVAAEIALRVYLTIGFLALVGLIVLGVTSTDGMIRRLGRRWNSLHRLVYAIAVLGLVHHFLQAKLDVTDPVFATGVFALLMGYRLLQRLGWTTGGPALFGLAAAAGLLTAGLEAAWYALKSGVPASLVLEANWDFSYKVSPAWWVFGFGLAASLLTAWRGRKVPAHRNRAQPAPNLNPATSPGS